MSFSESGNSPNILEYEIQLSCRQMSCPVRNNSVHQGRYFRYLALHRRMVSSGVLRRAALVRTYVSEELSASFLRVGLSSSETSVLTRATRRNIPEDTILHSHRRENLKSYLALHRLRS
jgi:hypothetical protein